MRVLVFPLDDDWFALPIEAVREVVPAPERPTPLPTAPRTVLGLFGVRGEIMPLLDTGVLLGLPALRAVACALVVETAWGVAALAVSGRPEARELDQPTAASETAATSGVWLTGDRLAVLIDAEAAVNPARVAGTAGPGPAVAA